MKRIAVYVERGDRKVFASAVDWPGWSRSGRTEAEAVQRLVEYAPRYARVVSRSRAGFKPPASVADLDITEHVRGGSGTDFGVPGEEARADDRPVGADELDRLRRLLTAAWRAVDRAAAEAEGVELRKGPRGGGRDVDRIVTHVLEAERAYLHNLGGRVPKEDENDMAAVRRVALQTLKARGSDRPVPHPSGVRRAWSIRYFVRRSAWHALDHAWEIEDRAEPSTDR